MKKILILCLGFLGIFVFAGVIQAADDANILQPASTITYHEDLTVNGTGRFNSVYIGTEGVGGVTFFNGTIVNVGETVPVTFGDDVRIDGQIWGGPNKGNASDQALKIADTLLPGLTNANDFGSSGLRWRDIYINDADLIGNLKVAGDVNLPTNSLNPEVINGTAWTSLNDGVGSGLNADLIDGKHATSFAPLSHNHDSQYVSKITPRWDAITSYIAVPSTSFQPIEDGYDYSISAIKINNDDSNSDFYNSSVFLPHNAVVTGFEIGWNDSDAGNDLSATLTRIHNISHSINNLASLSSTGNSGSDDRSATAIINYDTVDNYNYRYVISLYIPTSSIEFYNAKISYTIDQPY